MLPANLIKSHVNNIRYEATGYLYQAQNAAYVATYQTTNDFKADYVAVGNMGTGVSYQQWQTLTIG